MTRIAILASDNMLPDSLEQRSDCFERDEQMSKLAAASAPFGMTLDIIRWREAADRSNQFDAMLPLFVWDYFEGNEAAFLAQMFQAAQQTSVFNPPELLEWNSDKSYLEDLASEGLPVIATQTVDHVSPANVQQAFDDFGVDSLVIKPQVGGGAWRQVLQHRHEPLATADELPPGEALLQAFLPSVREEGEYSLIYIDGRFSHALIKRPIDGDYRIQSMYGGTEETYSPTTGERVLGERVLSALKTVPLYARVDLLRGQDRELKLIEVELIEPYLYLPHAPGEGGQNAAARKIAAALAERLN